MYESITGKQITIVRVFNEYQRKFELESLIKINYNVFIHIKLTKIRQIKIITGKTTEHFENYTTREIKQNYLPSAQTRF